jgi:hypothetical protein
LVLVKGPGRRLHAAPGPPVFGHCASLAIAVPVVFLVLPVTVLFAVFPGLAVLELHV